MRGQSTYESCLAWCLLYLAGEKQTLQREMEIVDHSLRFTKKDFTIGHLEAVSDKFKEMQLFIDTDFRHECNSVAQLRKSKNIRLDPCNVVAVVPLYLEEARIKRPFIVYLDAFVLWGYRHYPHYIIVLKEEEEKYHILDPWDGKTRIVPEQQILDGMVMLKEYLGFAPRAIRVTPR